MSINYGNMWNGFESCSNQYLLLDTETESLASNSCHILQISFIVTDYKFEPICEMYDTIIDAGVSVMNSFCHGITNERCRSEGICIIEALEVLYEYLQCSTHIVIYNANFDMNVIKTELGRFDKKGKGELGTKILSELNSKKIICPMKELKGIIVDKNRKGTFKYSKLGDCYKKIVGKEITNAHNSKYDVLNMLEMMQILYIQRETYKNMEQDLTGLTVTKLREICKNKGLKGYTKLNKEEIITKLSEKT